jgi:hypothetical protein
MQRVLHGKHDARAAVGQHWRVANELDCISQPLVRTDQDGLAFDFFRAEPHWLRKFRIARRRQSQPRLVSGPAGFELACQQMRKRRIPLGQRVIQLQRLHAIVEREDLVETMQVKQRDNLVVEGRYQVRLGLKSLVEPSQRLLIPTKPAQRRADIVARIGVVGIKLMRPFAFGQRCLEPFQVVERPRARLQRRGMVRQHLIGKIKTGNRLLVPGELVEQRPALVERARMIWVALEHVLKAEQRLIKARKLHQNVAELSP